MFSYREKHQKKNEIMPFAVTWMQLESTILSEVSQTEKQIPHDIIYTGSLKYDTNEPIYKTETDVDIENRPVVAKEKGTGGRIIE